LVQEIFQKFRDWIDNRHDYAKVWKKDNKITYKHFSTELTFDQADKMGNEREYGKTIYINLTKTSFPNRILTTLRAFKLGVLRFHYPVCCVLNFCIDEILRRPSWQLRYSDRTEYIECAIHIRLNGKQEIPEDLFT